MLACYDQSSTYPPARFSKVGSNIKISSLRNRRNDDNILTKWVVDQTSSDYRSPSGAKDTRKQARKVLTHILFIRT